MGDFDGDQMAVFLIPKEHEQEVMDKMSPVNLKFYDKDLSPIIMPSHGVMHGYISCSTVDYSLTEKKKVKQVDTLEELEEMYNSGQVELQEVVYLGEGQATTFGRAKIESYIGTTINKALGYPTENPLEPISNDNVEELMWYITNKKNSAEIFKDIRVFVLEMSTLEGFSSLSLPQIYPDVPKEFYQELEDIRNDSSLDGIQKFMRINEITKKMKKEVEANMDPELRMTMINSNRMKISALLEMTLPAATVNEDGEILSNTHSLYESLSEEEHRNHSLQNRMILNLKQNLVPRSGYLGRQLNFLSQGLEFKRGMEDKSNTGILLPKSRCEGRTTVDGKRLRKSNSDALVRVRSIAVSDKKYVTADMLNQVYFPEDEIASSWGLRVTTSLVEQMTQAGLSLKHSGSFIQVPTDNRLSNTSKASGKIMPNKRRGVLEIVDPSDSSKVKAEFPLPDKFDIINSEVSSGDYIGTTLQTSSAGLGLDKMVKILQASMSGTDEGLSKNHITLSPCFAPLGGEVKYDWEKKIFFIGDKLMGPIRSGAVYYYPNGAKVKKYDRIMSDPMDVAWYLKNDFTLEDTYSMFRKEFRYLLGNKDPKSGMTEELLETLFHLLIKKNFKTGKHEYLGTRKGIRKNNSSFFAQVSFSHGKDAMSKLASGELKFESDIFTRNILDYLILSAN